MKAKTKTNLLTAMCFMALLFMSCNNGRAYKANGEELSYRDSLILKQLKNINRQLHKDTYQLYPTKNMYTFLELNTISGQIWIVQWSIEDNKRFVYVLDKNARITEEDKKISGRFSLHPTENMYNFILLDNIDGRCWQVQWSFEENNRLVLPINE